MIPWCRVQQKMAHVLSNLFPVHIPLLSVQEDTESRDAVDALPTAERR